MKARSWLSDAATLTTLQQSGQNHHMRARATRTSSTRKTMATTRPLDWRAQWQATKLVRRLDLDSKRENQIIPIVKKKKMFTAEQIKPDPAWTLSYTDATSVFNVHSDNLASCLIEVLVYLQIGKAFLGAFANLFSHWLSGRREGEKAEQERRDQKPQPLSEGRCCVATHTCWCRDGVGTADERLAIVEADEDVHCPARKRRLL